MRYYAQISEIIDQMQKNEREYRKTMSDRLREARWSAGFESMALAAEQVGKTASTYRAHENGQNDYSHVEAQVYAKAFGVTAEWLLFGGNAPFVDGAPDIGSAKEGEILNFHQIARLRKRRGLTQKRLAELAGTSQPQIRRLENGERQLTKDWAERLAPHLGITAKELVFPDAMEPVDYDFCVKSNLTSIGEKIRAIMKVTGWNQHQVAEKFGVSQPTVNRWLSGSEPRGNLWNVINDQFAKLVENQTGTQNRPTDTKENSLRHATFPTVDGPVEIRFPKKFSTEGLRQLERYFSAFIENEKDS